MNNIYLVQVDALRKLPERYTAYLPYAAGALWAYARQAPEVAGGYTLGELFFLRHCVESVAARMEDPFLVGFSCYSWNTQYNLALARAVKARFPGCHILFGGHNVPPGGAMLEDNPAIDFLIHGEGELGFQALLMQLLKVAPDFTGVAGLSYRAGGSILTNPEAALACVADIPSPYLTGVFDPIVAAHPHICFSTVWETNRGCPNHCAFCDWGQHKARLRQFPMDRLMAEIGWMSANKVGFIYNADANFGILPRDEDLVDALAAAYSRTGYPYMFDCNTTKTINERLYRIVEKLHQSGLDRGGPNFAVQSLSPGVLRNIGRRNLDDETLARWIRRCRLAGYRTHTDLILGLPGETLQSFCAGVEKLFALGQHAGIRYFPCNLLPNALMATPAFREKYRLRTTRRIYRQTMEDAPEGQIDEFVDTIDETAAMPHSDWLTANCFMLLMGSVHSYGLLRLVAMYLHTQGIVPYAAFYLALLEYLREHPATLPGQLMARIEKHFADGIHGKETQPLEIPGFSFGSMVEDQYFFSRAVLAPDDFYAGVEPFLRQFGLEPNLLAQLLCYQHESILMPRAASGAGPDAEKVLAFDYDFPAYFSAIYDGKPVPLEKKPVRLRFFFAADLSTIEKYVVAVVRLGRLSSNAFYVTEYLAPAR